jgi:D-alanine-D-alanine ligase
MTPNCFVKPARSGSSVGVTKVNSDGQLGAAIEEAFKHGDTVLVESELLGREIECSVLEKSDGTICVSKAGEIRVHGREFYDYEAKYIDNSAELIVPAELSEQELSTLQELASTAFRALGCTGLARADFFLTAQGFVISEINTMPGFTPISMYPALWAASGLDYPELVESLIETGLTARR